MLNKKYFTLGTLIGLITLLIIFFPKAKADYLWNCTPNPAANGFNFTNTFESNKRVRCIQFMNCNCPGSPEGKCDSNGSQVWEKIVGPGESGTCSFSQSIDNCKLSQVDLRYSNTYEENWAEAPNCWYIAGSCIDCGGSPTPTPSCPQNSPTPTPTQPENTPTPTPTGEITPTPEEKNVCYDECGSDGDCSGGTKCQEVSGTKRCVNIDCPNESDCGCNRGCWNVCGTSNECDGGYSCKQIGDSKRCVPNDDCLTEESCCAKPTEGQVLGEEAPKVLPAAGIEEVSEFTFMKLGLLGAFLSLAALLL